MRLIKIIIGMLCVALAVIPGLLFLGELTFGFSPLTAACAIGLIGVGCFLIAKWKEPLSRKGKVLTAFVACPLVGFVALAVVPAFVSSVLSSSANPCINNLRQIDAAKNEWALENEKTNGDWVTENDLKPYIKLDSNGNLPKCPLGGTYTIGRIGEEPTCSIGTAAWPNDHVLTESNQSNRLWANFKSAYGILLGLRHLPKP